MSDRTIDETAEAVNLEDLDDRERAALDVVAEICARTGLDLRPEPRSRHIPYLDIEIVGPDASEAVGQHGHTLDAFQYLANLIAGRHASPDVRVILDAGGYRHRRAESLRNLARDYAAQVKELQQECEFEPMAAHERRLIHNALLDDPDVRTYSEGNDPYRRVIIAPR